jgi:hypothetical protein
VFVDALFINCYHTNYKCMLVSPIEYNNTVAITYTKLYDSTPWSTISYGAAIWGDRRMSCITAVQNRALRFCMGVGRYTPNTEVTGDTGWLDAEVKQWISVINHWFRLSTMSLDRINTNVFKWVAKHRTDRSCNNWCNRVRTRFKIAGIEEHFAMDTNIVCKSFVQSAVRELL